MHAPASTAHISHAFQQRRGAVTHGHEHDLPRRKRREKKEEKRREDQGKRLRSKTKVQDPSYSHAGFKLSKEHSTAEPQIYSMLGTTDTQLESEGSVPLCFCESRNQFIK